MKWKVRKAPIIVVFKREQVLSDTLIPTHIFIKTNILADPAGFALREFMFFRGNVTNFNL